MPSSTRSVRGLGARLLLAFFAISVFSALVAGAAIYAFHQVGRSLDLVDRRVDPILAANEVSRSVERIINSSGNLSSVTTEQARERVFAGLSAKSAKLQSLLTQLRDAGIAEERLAPIEKYAAQLDADLTALDGDVRRRLQLIGLIKDLMRGVFDTNDETQRLLSPTLLVYDSQITRLVGLMDTSAGGTEPTWQTIRPLISGLLAERDAQRVQQQTSNIADGLAQASVSEDTQRLVILAFQLRRKVVDLEKGAQGLDPKLRPLFLAEVDKFKTLVDGSDSIPLLRQRELDIVADANRLIAENSALSDQLTAASEELVQATRREVKAATGSALEVQRVSTEAITALVVLSLLTSLLIVWRYVGRNIVARLNRLSAAMLVIAGGDHREEVMVSGDDEIAAMGQAVEVFRQNAIERDELLAERAEAAERLEQTVADRTAELTESLEYQTATSDVLKVISRSTFDLQPVLQALVETAARLCETDMAFLLCREKETFRSGAAVGFSDEYKKYLGTHPLPISRGSTTGRVALEKRIIHIPDCAADPEYTHNQSVELAGQRTSLGVPLLREDDVIGAIVLARKRVEPFTERQIELVRTFADQAVIAMENARLITETGEALEQQTATAEVLQVINSSTGDLAPVFATVAESAVMLCGADKAFIFRYDGELLLAEATFNASEELKEFVAQNPIRPGRHSGAARCALERRTVHIPDVIADPEYGYGAKAVDPIRTVLAVPMLKGDELLGVILVYHFEVRPFSDKQIALIETFADQAAIAIENTRLITETREALEQQTATAEVLGVINASPGQVAPVFDTMLDKAMRLCEAAFGALFLFEDDRFTPAASHSVPGAYAAFLAANTMLPGPGTAPYRFLRGGERAVIQEEDLADSGPYRAGDPQRRALVDLGGARSTIQVPLRKDAAVLGVITLYRQEVRPFSEKQTALLQNFAAQAVIAMENARLITETRERTAELQESLEYQTATSDVLKVISQSDADLTYVLQTTLDTAARLCAAGWGHIFLRRDERLQTMASLGVTDENRAEMEANPVAVDAHTMSGRTVLTGQVVQIGDIAADPEYAHALTLAAGIRTMLGVPLLRDGVPIGAIALGRTVVEPFTGKQMELVRTFADQAVIAIENTRLLSEIQQRQAELRVTFDNMADAVAMFDQTLHLAAWNRNFEEMLHLPEALLADRPAYDAYIRYLAERGEFGDSDPETEIARLRARFADHFSFERTRPDGTVLEVRHNPMPDGGVVLIYSDITERKRSEEEIRAARDAAETAYRNLQAAQANLVQAQKMAALGQLTAGIAHEIKNPLNFVNNFASLSVELLDELKETAAPALAALDEDKRADVDNTMELLTGNLEKIAEHGKRADNIVKSMLEHSRGVSGERREVDLNGVIEEALNLAYHGARAHDQSFNITLERDYAESLKPIELSPQEMTRVFLNLFGNGFYAANKRARDNGDGSFRPVLAVRTREDGDGIEVRVRDNGTGIPPEIKDKLFQPFFTTKPTGEGTGLGLSISYDIVTQQHGGTISVDSEPGTYTEFIIRLPLR